MDKIMYLTLRLLATYRFFAVSGFEMEFMDLKYGLQAIAELHKHLGMFRFSYNFHFIGLSYGTSGAHTFTLGLSVPNQQVFSMRGLPSIVSQVLVVFSEQ
jgi:hypothetical protein